MKKNIFVFLALTLSLATQALPLSQLPVVTNTLPQDEVVIEAHDYALPKSNTKIVALTDLFDGLIAPSKTVTDTNTLLLVDIRDETPLIIPNYTYQTNVFLTNAIYGGTYVDLGELTHFGYDTYSNANGYVIQPTVSGWELLNTVGGVTVISSAAVDIDEDAHYGPTSPEWSPAIYPQWTNTVIATLYGLLQWPHFNTGDGDVGLTASPLSALNAPYVWNGAGRFTNAWNNSLSIYSTGGTNLLLLTNSIFGNSGVGTLSSTDMVNWYFSSALNQYGDDSLVATSAWSQAVSSYCVSTLPVTETVTSPQIINSGGGIGSFTDLIPGFKTIQNAYNATCRFNFGSSRFISASYTNFSLIIYRAQVTPKESFNENFTVFFLTNNPAGIPGSYTATSATELAGGFGTNLVPSSVSFSVPFGILTNASAIEGTCYNAANSTNDLIWSATLSSHLNP